MHRFAFSAIPADREIQRSQRTVDICISIASVERMENGPNDLLPQAIGCALKRVEAGVAELRAALVAQSADGGGPVTREHVRLVISARRLRSELLPSDFFSEPAWDVLLEVFARHLEGTEGCLSEIAEAASIPNTTALRSADKLKEEGLLVRQVDPSDARRVILQLSNLGERVMQSYFRKRIRLGR